MSMKVEQRSGKMIPGRNIILDILDIREYNEVKDTR